MSHNIVGFNVVSINHPSTRRGLYDPSSGTKDWVRGVFGWMQSDGFIHSGVLIELPEAKSSKKSGASAFMGVQ